MEDVLPTKLCALCDAAVTGQGEHVYPRWFLDRWSGQGKFTWDFNMEPLRRRGGEIFYEDPISPDLLPMCSGCNSWLNLNFELAGHPAVTAVMDQMVPVDASMAAAFARWWTKTLLLQTHPDAVSATNARIREPGQPDRVPVSKPWGVPVQLYRDFRQTGQFPEDLSLWMVTESRDGGRSPDEVCRIHLPWTFQEGGAGGLGQCAMRGFNLMDGRTLTFQLVYHPLCDIEHPFEAAGLATRLWPNPPTGLDIGAHPDLSPEGGERFQHIFGVGGIGIGVPLGQRLPLRPGDISPWEAFGFTVA